jgi:hypothetical protein
MNTSNSFSPEVVDDLGTPAAAQFMRSTFDFIASGKPHVVGAAFHYYLERHIHLDEDFHGPLSLRMVNELVGGDAARLSEAQAAARAAVQARIGFWDGVKSALR